jgi:hypothetical protein
MLLYYFCFTVALITFLSGHVALEILCAVPVMRVICHVAYHGSLLAVLFHFPVQNFWKSIHSVTDGPLWLGWMVWNVYSLQQLC